MWHENWTPIEENSSALIKSCRGRKGQAWGYVVSHTQLLLRFYDDGEMSSTYLWCKGCEEVSFNTSWEDSNLKLSISKPGQYPETEIIDDENLKVICGFAFWAESDEFLHLEDAMKIPVE